MTTSVQHSMQYYQVSNPQVCHCSHPLSLSLTLTDIYNTDTTLQIIAESWYWKYNVNWQAGSTFLHICFGNNQYIDFVLIVQSVPFFEAYDQ